MTWRAVIDVPIRGRSGQSVGDLSWVVAGVDALDHRLRWRSGAQIERDLERFGAFQDRPEEFVIQVAAAAVTVDQGSFETMRGDRTPQLVGSCVRYRGWQRCEAGKPEAMVRISSLPFCSQTRSQLKASRMISRAMLGTFSEVATARILRTYRSSSSWASMVAARSARAVNRPAM